MAVLASYTGKTNSTEAEVTVPSTGPVTFLLYGQLGPSAIVTVYIKTADSVFTAFPETTFFLRTATVLYLSAGDKIKIQFQNCLNASAEFKQ